MGELLERKTNETDIDSIFDCTNHFIDFMGGISDIEILNEPSFTACISEVPHPIVNSVIDAQFNPHSVKNEIQNLMSHFQEKGNPVFWYLWPNSHPTDLGKHLIDFGFKHAQNSPGMLADLTLLPENTSNLPDLRIELVRSDEMVKEMTKLLGIGFEMPEDVLDLFSTIFINAGYDESCRMKNHIAYLDDKIVACVTLNLDDNKTAGIWNVVTIPEVRGKGIGTMITWHACNQAQNLGYQKAILISSEMGFNVYKSLGFQEICKIGYYLWSPEGENGG